MNPMLKLIRIPGGEQPGIFSSIQNDAVKANRTTYRISPHAKQAMNVRLTQDGYGLRGKSRWIRDVITTFLAKETWGSLAQEEGGIWKRIVVDTEARREVLIKDAINVDENLRITLWHASIDAALYGAKLEEPVYLEISISSIIRAAIMWKLGQEIEH